MEDYEIISMLRKDKGIKVKDFIESIMSRSNYNRYITGQNDIAVHTYKSLINKLNISENEFEFIKNGYASPEQYKYFYTVLDYLKKKKAKELSALNQIFIQKSKTTRSSFYIHMGELTEYLIQYLKDDKRIMDIRKSNIYTYLIDTELWTHYELSLFKLLIYVLPCDTLDFMYHRVKRDLDKYCFFHQHGNEGFRITYEIICILLNRGVFTKAIEYIEEIESYNLSGDFYYEMIIQNFLSKLKYQMLQCNDTNDNLEEFFSCLESLGFHNLITEFKSLMIASKVNF